MGPLQDRGPPARRLRARHALTLARGTARPPVGGAIPRRRPGHRRSTALFRSTACGARGCVAAAVRRSGRRFRCRSCRRPRSMRPVRPRLERPARRGSAGCEVRPGASWAVGVVCRRRGPVRRPLTGLGALPLARSRRRRCRPVPDAAALSVVTVVRRSRPRRCRSLPVSIVDRSGCRPSRSASSASVLIDCGECPGRHPRCLPSPRVTPEPSRWRRGTGRGVAGRGGGVPPGRSVASPAVARRGSRLGGRGRRRPDGGAGDGHDPRGINAAQWSLSGQRGPSWRA